MHYTAFRKNTYIHLRTQELCFRNNVKFILFAMTIEIIQNHVSNISHNTAVLGSCLGNQSYTLHGGKWAFLLESFQIYFGPNHSPGRTVKQAFSAGLQQPARPSADHFLHRG